MTVKLPYWSCHLISPQLIWLGKFCSDTMAIVQWNEGDNFSAQYYDCPSRSCHPQVTCEDSSFFSGRVFKNVGLRLWGIDSESRLERICLWILTTCLALVVERLLEITRSRIQRIVLCEWAMFCLWSELAVKLYYGFSHFSGHQSITNVIFHRSFKARLMLITRCIRMEK